MSGGCGRCGPFLDGQIPALGQGEPGQQLGDVGADQVCAEQLPVCAIGDDYGEPGGIAVAVGFSVGTEGDLATAMSLPRAAASARARASVSPKLATWGWQNVTRGIIVSSWTSLRYTLSGRATPRVRSLFGVRRRGPASWAGPGSSWALVSTRPPLTGYARSAKPANHSPTNMFR